MKKTRLAVIGGSGIYNLDVMKVIKKHSLKTPFGSPSSPIIEAELIGEKTRFFFLARHGEGHVISPSEINYRANIFALKKLGAESILSISAVGSLKEEIAPGTIALPDQFIDWTKGFRERSFFGKGMVGHVSTANPVTLSLRDAAAETCSSLGLPFKKCGAYVCIEGPQFSTRAESAIYRSFNASLIGMTNVPEAFLAKEAGMAYATIALVTDYDCWKDAHCTLEEILKIMAANYNSVQKILVHLLPKLEKYPINFSKENMHAIITAPKKLGPKHKEIAKILMR